MDVENIIRLVKKHLKGATEDEVRFNGKNEELRIYFEGKKMAFKSVLDIMENA